MIVEQIIDDGASVLHCSSRGVKILQVETGIVYDEAIDVNPCPYTYEETNEPLNPPEIPEEEADFAEAGRILLGVEE